MIIIINYIFRQVIRHFIIRKQIVWRLDSIFYLWSGFFDTGPLWDAGSRFGWLSFPKTKIKSKSKTPRLDAKVDELVHSKSKSEFIKLQTNTREVFKELSARKENGELSKIHGENFMAIFTTLSVVIWFSTGTLGIFATLFYVFTMSVVIYDILSMVIISTLSTSIVFWNLCYILLWISPRSVVKISIRIQQTLQH